MEKNIAMYFAGAAVSLLSVLLAGAAPVWALAPPAFVRGEITDDRIGALVPDSRARVSAGEVIDTIPIGNLGEGLDFAVPLPPNSSGWLELRLEGAQFWYDTRPTNLGNTALELAQEEQAPEPPPEELPGTPPAPPHETPPELPSPPSPQERTIDLVNRPPLLLGEEVHYQQGAGNHIIGERVSLYAGYRQGFTFAGWDIVPQNQVFIPELGWEAITPDGLLVEAARIQFDMPATALSITARWDFEQITPRALSYPTALSVPTLTRGFIAPANTSGAAMGGQRLQYIGQGNEADFYLDVVLADTIRVSWSEGEASQLRIPLVLRRIEPGEILLRISASSPGHGTNLDPQGYVLAPFTGVGAVMRVGEVATGRLSATLSPITITENISNGFVASELSSPRGFFVDLNSSPHTFNAVGRIEFTGQQNSGREIMTYQQRSTNPRYTGPQGTIPQSYSFSYFNEGLSRIYVVFGTDLGQAQDFLRTIRLEGLEIAQRDPSSPVFSSNPITISAQAFGPTSADTGIRGGGDITASPLPVAILAQEAGRQTLGVSRRGSAASIYAGISGLSPAQRRGDYYALQGLELLGSAGRLSRTATIIIEETHPNEWLGGKDLAITLTNRQGTALYGTRLVAAHTHLSSPHMGGSRDFYEAHELLDRFFYNVVGAQDSQVFANNQTLRLPRLTRVANTQDEDGRAYVELTLFVSSSLDFEGNVYARVNNQNPPVHIATVHPPVEIAISPSDVYLGRDGQEVGDITIRERRTGQLRGGTSLELGVSDIFFDTSSEDIAIRAAGLYNTGGIAARQQSSSAGILVDIGAPSLQNAVSTITLTGVEADVPEGIFRGEYSLFVSGSAIADNTGNLLNAGLTQAQNGYSRFAFNQGSLRIPGFLRVGMTGDYEEDFDTESLFAHVIVSADNGTAIVNGVPIPLTTGPEQGNVQTPPLLYNDRLYIPLRALSLIFGARNEREILWNPNTNMATIMLGDTHTTWEANQQAHSVNGASRSMSAASFISTPYFSQNPATWDRLYIPFRYFGYAFGMQVDWDETTDQAHFNKN